MSAAHFGGWLERLSRDRARVVEAAQTTLRGADFTLRRTFGDECEPATPGDADAPVAGAV